jgi:hypothetical protein
MICRWVQSWEFVLVELGALLVMLALVLSDAGTP